MALYRDSAITPDDAVSRRFRSEHSVSRDGRIPIQCIGVWDTVGALGMPAGGARALTRRKHEFHDTELSGAVKFGFQALAIDEYRPPFRPTLWLEKPKAGQTIEQVWFAGAHSDVGGGYLESELSDLTLTWMIDRAAAAGLVFDAPTMSALPLAANHLGAVHDSRRHIYRLMRRAARPIGVAVTPKGEDPAFVTLDPTQSISAPAIRRWDEDAAYRPRALETYFERSGDARAAA